MKRKLLSLLLAVLLLAVLGGSMTSCMSGAGQITSIKKGYSISDSMITEDAGMTAVALDHLADDIAAKKNGFEIREQLVAALRGYDMLAPGFNDANVKDGTLAAQPEKAVEFAIKVLNYHSVDTTTCYTVTAESADSTRISNDAENIEILL
jgi:hypothetical protein